MPPRPGDGWAAGPNGTKVWGTHGAAGLALVAEGKILLQLRAHWTASGGTWSLAGGAREPTESATEAAAREAFEETGIRREQFEVLKEVQSAGPFPADPSRPELPGGWTYTTVIAAAERILETEANEESEELRWVPFEEVDALPLIPAFRESWPRIRKEIELLIEGTA